jgi:hypothetical protein
MGFALVISMGSAPADADTFKIAPILFLLGFIEIGYGLFRWGRR